MELRDSRRSRRGLPDFLAAAQDDSAQDRFEEARNTLYEALKLPDLSEDEVSLISEELRNLDDRLGRQLHQLVGEVETQLAKEPDSVGKADLDAGRGALARLKALAPQLPPDLEQLEKRWGDFRARAERLLGLKEARRKLEMLWQRPYTKLSAYDEAMSLAQRMAQDFPEEPKAQEMLEEAKTRRKKARDAQGALETAQVEGDFKTVLSELKRFSREGVAELPLYDWGLEWKDEEGQRRRSLVPGSDVPVEAALEQIRNLAQQYEENKASEYLGQAEAQLREQPAAAAERVKEAKAFEYLSPSTREELDRFLEEETRPALERRDRANGLARAALEPGKTELEAWGLVTEAEGLDPYATEVARARDELLPSFRLHLEDEFHRAEETRRAGDFEAAAVKTSAVLDTIGEFQPLEDLAQKARLLKRDCISDRDFFESVRAGSAAIQELASSNLPAAAQALSELEARVAGRPESFQRLLLGAGSAVRARQSLEALLAGWENRFRRLAAHAKSKEDLRAALDEVDLLEYEADEERGSRGASPELQDLLGRLDSRRRFLEARRDWMAGLYDRAIASWRQVVERKGEDADLAREWLARAEDDNAVGQALEQAEAQRGRKEYRLALEALDKWRTAASSKSREVRALFRDIEDEWADRLTSEIQELIESKHPVYARLVEKIEALKQLKPEKARQYQQEHLAPIYEEWGDRNLSFEEYEKAAEYYQQAASLATGEGRLRLERKLHLLRRKQNDRQIEDLLTRGKHLEARERLTSWLNVQDPNYGPGFYWLASLFLEEEETESARMYLQQLERRLDAAERAGDSARAGLQSAEAITRWRLHLELLSEKTRATIEIREAKKQISEWLRLEGSIREYRRAKGAFVQLIEKVSAIRQSLAGPEPSASGEDALGSQEAEDHVPPSQEVQRWLDEQLRSTGLRSWFGGAERELLRRLREEWQRTTPAVDLETLDLRAAPPTPEVLERWSLGLKIRFLFADSAEGERALLEISEAQTKLDRAVRELTQDERGPENGLEGESLTPRMALEAQLQWSDRLRSWAVALAELLGNYVWAYGIKETEERLADASESERAVVHGTERTYEGTREIRATKADIEKFQRSLFDLMGALREAEMRLAQAVAAGRDGQVRWEHAQWADVVVEILRSPKIPPPVDGGRELPRAYWAKLDADDPDVRLDAWRKAVEIIGMRGGASEALSSARFEIDEALRQVGLEEGWEEVDAALKNHLVYQHSVVKNVSKRRDAARKKRNLLVNARIILVTLVNAEELTKALEQMEWMKKLDREDLYGFRSGEVASTPEPLEWEQWRAWIEESQRQLEAFRAWRPDGEGDTHTLWQESKRGEFLGLMDQALFVEAERLGREIYRGEGDGQTEPSNGSLALMPLLERLEAVPPEFVPSLSQRLKRELAELERKRRTLRGAVSELRFWLEGTGGPGPAELNQSIAVRESAFRNQVDRLRAALEVLQVPSWLRQLLYRWRPGLKEAQRRYCRQAWDDLYKMAPKWAELDANRRAIEEA